MANVYYKSSGEKLNDWPYNRDILPISLHHKFFFEHLIQITASFGAPFFPELFFLFDNITASSFASKFKCIVKNPLQNNRIKWLLWYYTFLRDIFYLPAKTHDAHQSLWCTPPIIRLNANRLWKHMWEGRTEERGDSARKPKHRVSMSKEPSLQI